MMPSGRSNLLPTRQTARGGRAINALEWQPVSVESSLLHKSEARASPVYPKLEHMRTVAHSFLLEVICGLRSPLLLNGRQGPVQEFAQRKISDVNGPFLRR